MKIYRLMAAAAMFSMLLVSCDKDDDKKDGNGEDDGKIDPVEAGITIDGTFTDWNALKAEDVVSASIQADDDMRALKTIKFYDTEEFLYCYAEVDATYMGTAFSEADKWDIGKNQPRPIRFLWDIDANDETGGVHGYFSDEPFGIDVLTDIYVWADAGKVKLGWSELWNYKSSVEAGKTFISNIEQNTTLNDLVVTAANLSGSLVAGGYYGVEFAFDKTLIPDLGKTVKIGVTMINDSWGEPGCIPSSGAPFTLNLK